MFKSYLVGTRREKEKINALLTRNQPMFDSYDFQYLCTNLVEKLIVNDCRNLNQFDYLLCEYLDDLEVDTGERMNDKTHEKYMSYLYDVESALGYFRNYLELLDMFPIPIDLEVLDGTRNTVLKLRISM